jgi:hypothetical protein
MAPRAPISVGIQPQIAMYSVILGAVCAFGKSFTIVFYPGGRLGLV